jgi:hypothetical protein
MAARERSGDSDVRDYRTTTESSWRLTLGSRTTANGSRLPEYLGTLEAPGLTDTEIASIDEAGAKQHHRHFVRRTEILTLTLSSADIPI